MGRFVYVTVNLHDFLLFILITLQGISSLSVLVRLSHKYHRLDLNLPWVLPS